MQTNAKTMWKIYNYIKQNSINGKWTTQKEIQEYLKNDNQDVCLRTIRRYVQQLRQDDTIQKIILTDYVKGYQLMSSEEEKEYLVNRKIAILKMLKRYYKDVKRFESNNQYRIFENKERNIIESLIELKESGEV